MEKPVEIVEKCEFSTAIPEISNLCTCENLLDMQVHKQNQTKFFEIMSPPAESCYRQKFGEKVSKMPKPPG